MLLCFFTGGVCCCRLIYLDFQWNSWFRLLIKLRRRRYTLKETPVVTQRKYVIIQQLLAIVLMLCADDRKIMPQMTQNQEAIRNFTSVVVPIILSDVIGVVHFNVGGKDGYVLEIKHVKIITQPEAMLKLSLRMSMSENDQGV